MAPALLCKLFPRSLSRSSRDAGAGTASRGCCGGSHPTRLCKEKTLWCSPADRWGAKVGGPITQGCYECNSQLLKSIYPPPFFFCIMQRMPPFLGFATPHPSPETNHCRARASAQRPRPLPGPHAATTTAATATSNTEPLRPPARRLLKGGGRS